MKTDFILSVAKAVQRTILANENTLESLDRAISDGDHYINMKRGANAIVDIQAELATLSPSEAINKIGLKLLSTIGGASGPLLASFLMVMAKVLKENGDESVLKIAAAFAAGVQAIIQRMRILRLEIAVFHIPFFRGGSVIDANRISTYEHDSFKRILIVPQSFVQYGFQVKSSTR